MTEIAPALVLAPAVVYLLGALAAPSGRHRALGAHLLALAGSAAGLAVAAWTLLAGETWALSLGAATPFASLAFRLDPLAGFFLLVISVVALPVSLYAIGYLADEPGDTAALGVAYNAFLAAMGLVVVADSALTFLLAWEVMSLASYFLVMHDHRQRETRRAGFVYLVMTHFGTGFILLSFLTLFIAGGGQTLDFAAFRDAGPGLSAFSRNAVFLLALVGFATKAGVIPLHIWLPRAHPAAPSHVSALMSGVMIKTALYGLLRVGWDFAGPGPTWWGGLILALGAVSAVLGVLYALMERDLKRLLAYSSVENIGIILLSLGAAFMLAPLGHPAAAALALAAGLAHILNHGLFKGLLFLGAGAIQHATHTRDLERLGGLIRRMPQTAALFLIGAASIAAIVPLNGFQSEWLTFQALLQVGAAATGPAIALGAATAVGALALTGGLAAFTFVKAFAVAFLGIPRSEHVAGAHEAAPTMRLGMGFLALLCVALGLVPALMLRLVAPVGMLLTGEVALPAAGPRPTSLAAPGGGRYFPLAVLLALAIAAALALALGRLLGGPGRERVAPPWVCGVRLESRMPYTASALTMSLRRIFEVLLRPDSEHEPEHAQAPFFVAAVRYDERLHPVYERYLYTPAVGAILALAKRLRVVQNGQLRTYLAYLFATLIIVLLITR